MVAILPTRGGCLWEVVAHEGSTVIVIIIIMIMIIVICDVLVVVSG